MTATRGAYRSCIHFQRLPSLASARRAHSPQRVPKTPLNHPQGACNCETRQNRVRHESTSGLVAGPTAVVSVARLTSASFKALRLWVLAAPCPSDGMTHRGRPRRAATMRRLEHGGWTEESLDTTCQAESAATGSTTGDSADTRWRGRDRCSICTMTTMFTNPRLSLGQQLHSPRRARWRRTWAAWRSSCT